MELSGVVGTLGSLFSLVFYDWLTVYTCTNGTLFFLFWIFFLLYQLIWSDVPPFCSCGVFFLLCCLWLQWFSSLSFFFLCVFLFPTVYAPVSVPPFCKVLTRPIPKAPDVADINGVWTLGSDFLSVAFTFAFAFISSEQVRFDQSTHLKIHIIIKFFSTIVAETCW